ncbi:hypothetical protein I4I65_16660 [Xanthomonas campestris pv. campestris]|nr:hypothetical protein [Xanthomonas campestris pv. campestris]BBJ99814.1 hypothetical protein Xcc3_11220 [Xanthomonas campestris pv. campestris]
MHGFDDVVVAAHGQRLRVGQRLLEPRGELVHPHEKSSELVAGVSGDTVQMRLAGGVSRPGAVSTVPGSGP